MYAARWFGSCLKFYTWEIRVFALVCIQRQAKYKFTVHLVVINQYVQVQMLKLIHLCNQFTVSGDLRLSRGFTTSSSFTSGRLEVFVFGRWGTVCGDFWDSTNSDVACRQLGFPGAARPTSFATSSSTGWEIVLPSVYYKRWRVLFMALMSFTKLTHTPGYSIL